jgi:hypothetical protein
MDKIINRFIKKFIIVSEPLFCEEKSGMVCNEIEYHWYNNDGQIIFISYGEKGGGIVGYSSFALENLMLQFNLTFDEAVKRMSIYIEENKETIIK